MARACGGETVSYLTERIIAVKRLNLPQAGLTKCTSRLSDGFCLLVAGANGVTARYGSRGAKIPSSEFGGQSTGLQLCVRIYSDRSHGHGGELPFMRRIFSGAKCL